MGKLEILHQIKKLFLVNFPVVAGGFALLAATGATQAVVGAAAPALSTSFVGGAAALLGRLKYYPQRAQRAGGIVRYWQIFGYGSDFPTWSEVGTKSRAKVPNFEGNFEPSYLWTGKSF